MRDPGEIVQLYHSLKNSRAPWVQKAREIKTMYEGAMVVPLPELDADEKPAAVNLLGPGLDQLAMRVASVLPDQSWPALRDGFQGSTDKARQRRKACLAWWDMNTMKLILRLRARHLLGYGTSAVTLSPGAASPFDKREIPHWYVRDPLEVFTPPTSNPLDFEPLFAIICQHQTLAWLKLRYPEAYSRLRKGSKKDDPTAVFDVIEYHDHEQAGTLIAIGSADEAVAPRWGAQVGVQDGTASYVVLGEPVPNRAEIPLVVFPGRITLSDPRGMFDSLIGKYLRASKLDALQTIAVQRAIFPEEWVVSHPNAPGTAKIITPADGKSGIRGVIQNGVIQTIAPQPNQQVDLAIDRLERTERVEGGIPAELNGECVDEETEILTADGWKRYDQVSAGDEVLTLNHETGESEWQIVQRMNVYRPMRRELVEMHGSRFSSLTTVNHRWPVLQRVDRGKAGYRIERSWVTSETLAERDRIPLCAPNAHLPLEPKYDDALVELVAWYWTEGTTSHGRDGERTNRVSIAQSVTAHEENVERIRRTLTALFGLPTPQFPRQGRAHDGIPRWREGKPNKYGVVNFWLSAGASRIVHEFVPDDEKVPRYDFLRSLTQEQLELFIDVSMLADNFGGYQFGQANKARAEAFAFACILAGYAVSYREQVRHERRPGFKPGPQRAYVVSKRSGTVVKPVEASRRGSTTIRKVDHEGIIWCPTTPNGTWFARRDGNAYFTGNSASNIRTARRGAAVLGSNVDMPVQEAQEILEVSLEAEDRRAVAIQKAYFGNKTFSFYVGRDGKNLPGADTYVPEKVFETDVHFVKYSMPGSDMNGQIIGMGQRVGLGTLSTETFMEMDPAVEDVELEKSRVAQDGIRKAFLAFIEQGAASGQVGGDVIARILQKMQDPKVLPEDAFTAVHQEMQAEQQSQQEAAQAGQPPGPEAQPGALPPNGQAPGAGPGPGMPIGPPQPSTQNLAQILGALRAPASQSPAERAMAGAQR